MAIVACTQASASLQNISNLIDKSLSCQIVECASLHQHIDTQIFSAIQILSAIKRIFTQAINIFCLSFIGILSPFESFGLFCVMTVCVDVILRCLCLWFALFMFVVCVFRVCGLRCSCLWFVLFRFVVCVV